MSNMISDEDNELKDSVQRLHRYVIDQLRLKRDDPFSSPVTVAEIYQELAPYRTVRSTIGFEMNADYEHALVRMLSGVDGLTKLEPDKAREKLRRELDSPNPDVTMYREFAACDVILNPANPGADWVREQLEDHEMIPESRGEALDTTPTVRAIHSPETRASAGRASTADWSALAALSAADEEPEPPQPAAWPPPAAMPRSASRQDAVATEGMMAGYADPGNQAESADPRTSSVVSAASHGREADMQSQEITPIRPSSSGTPAAQQGTDSTHHSCSYCDSELPAARNLRFCPFCGADQSVQPCGSCGEPVEAGWSFCIACGTAVASQE